MKKSEVSVGKTYIVKVSGNLTRVRLDSVSEYGGWNGTNLQTGRSVRIKSAAKLRREVVPNNAPINKNKVREESLGTIIDKAFDALPESVKECAKEMYPEIREEKKTPWMRQWSDLCEQHPDKIILLRVGDFWETFDEAAETVAKLCGLTLTRRGEYPMVGFPHYCTERYLAILLRAGHKVALCEPVKMGEIVPKTEIHVVRGSGELVET